MRPLAATSWSRMAAIGGAYSCALPGQSQARARLARARLARATLARPFEDRRFFAGEATHPCDFTTAHGAHDSGRRAADEVEAVLRAGVPLNGWPRPPPSDRDRPNGDTVASPAARGPRSERNAHGPAIDRLPGVAAKSRSLEPIQGARVVSGMPSMDGPRSIIRPPRIRRPSWLIPKTTNSIGET
ncbi:FAD-dependent oxidoreductase [Methylobacterium sp. GXS13]|uniref:FAD-dependent oxidoreductase n=1 Tax=Methylobacterium sp. GXS13 TaxID=1730094 RepID=UPI001FCD2771|nr:FAD-dependent oxidoreductase [Methylobacterium sp. GXS13]